MKKRTKITLAGFVVLAGALLLTGCTKSFCSTNDKAHILYAIDYGVSDYYDHEVEDSTQVFAGNTNLYYKVNVPVSSGSGIVKVTNDAIKANLPTPSLNYFVHFDQIVLETALKSYYLETQNVEITDFTAVTFDDALNALDKYGYLKFSGNNLWDNWDDINNQLKVKSQEAGSGIVLDDLPNKDYLALYKKDLNSMISGYRSCIAIKDGKYGYYGYANGAEYRKHFSEIGEAEKGPVAIEAKSWASAWNLNGKFTFWEGLLVYPIAWLTETFVAGFKTFVSLPGLAQLLAIFAITFIVRSVMLVVTIKQTAGNAKMTALQPEITKIQNKYPNANTNNYEKQQMAQEMNRLYKKNKINPLSTLLVMVVQFPVFICVWGALQGCASLSSDAFLNLHLSDSINNVLFNGANWSNGSAVTALFLFLFMAGAQVISMLLPQWIQAKKRKQVASLGKNPAQNEQQNRMKMFTYVMMAMIIFMGFTLPSAMGVYWFVGALFSIVQTLIIEKINSSKAKKKGNK